VLARSCTTHCASWYLVAKVSIDANVREFAQSSIRILVRVDCQRRSVFVFRYWVNSRCLFEEEDIRTERRPRAEPFQLIEDSFFQRFYAYRVRSV